MSSGGGWSSPWRDHVGAGGRSQFVLFRWESRRGSWIDEQGGSRRSCGSRSPDGLFVSSPGAPVSAKACRRRALAGCVAAALLALSPGVALAAGSGDPAAQAKATADAKQKQLSEAKKQAATTKQRLDTDQAAVASAQAQPQAMAAPARGA